MAGWLSIARHRRQRIVFKAPRRDDVYLELLDIDVAKKVAVIRFDGQRITALQGVKTHLPAVAALMCVTYIDDNRAQIAIQAPAHVTILRTELDDSDRQRVTSQRRRDQG